MTLAGFDCDQTHISCLEDGTVRFTVLRKPLAVGYEGLRSAVDMVTGTWRFRSVRGRRDRHAGGHPEAGERPADVR